MMKFRISRPECSDGMTWNWSAIEMICVYQSGMSLYPQRVGRRGVLRVGLRFFRHNAPFA